MQSAQKGKYFLMLTTLANDFTQQLVWHLPGKPSTPRQCSPTDFEFVQNQLEEKFRTAHKQVISQSETKTDDQIIRTGQVQLNGHLYEATLQLPFSKRYPDSTDTRAFTSVSLQAQNSPEKLSITCSGNALDYELFDYTTPLGQRYQASSCWAKHDRHLNLPLYQFLRALL